MIRSYKYPANSRMHSKSQERAGSAVAHAHTRAAAALAWSGRASPATNGMGVLPARGLSRHLGHVLCLPSSSLRKNVSTVAAGDLLICSACSFYAKATDLNCHSLWLWTHRDRRWKNRVTSHWYSIL